MQTVPLPAHAQVEQAVREVFRQPEFAEVHRQPGVWDWIVAQLLDALRRVLGYLARFVELRDTAPLIYWVVVVWLGLTALALLGHILYTSASAFARDRAHGGADEPAVRGPRGAAEWEAMARRAAAEGRLREAALALYHAVLLRLDARGAVRYDPSKTPGDYRREVRAHPDAARPFAAFLRGLEPVAFGGRALDADGYERLRAAAGEAGARG
jgi:hypothetical protein